MRVTEEKGRVMGNRVQRADLALPEGEKEGSSQTYKQLRSTVPVTDWSGQERRDSSQRKDRVSHSGLELIYK